MQNGFVCLFVSTSHSPTLITSLSRPLINDLQGPFANPLSIEANHRGVTTLLAHFHYINKGYKPFCPSVTSAHLAMMAELDAQQVSFIEETAAEVRRRRTWFQIPVSDEAKTSLMKPPFRNLY
jgi:hypothetical protein